MIIYLLGVYAVASAILLITVGMLLHRAHQSLDRTLDALDIETLRASTAVAKANTLSAQQQSVLLNITPLLEKTDWMTGRWGGQFETLVSLEKKRNDSVDIVRKSLMDNPVVKHYVIDNPSVMRGIMGGVSL